MRDDPFGLYSNEDAWQDVAQICTNGHVINATSKSMPEDNRNFCQDCGAKTVTQCPNGHDIRGRYHEPGVFDVLAFPAPSFCGDCGVPYPWIASRLDAARELAEELEELTPEEQQALTQSLDDLVRDTPRTTVAATRFKKVMAKAGGGAAAAGFKEILVSVVTEAAKKLIWPM